ncbi:MAG: MBL fold metallo-hydrolase [Acidobacteria bacterium]|nr:MBL fold metallo-hydrolase [Acidobacteriota bacterium]MCH8970474.1 MBL fold metallo-hydrolase [Acidobacteriota bacterium]TDI36892.1 MAG: MBL fold metallo-hydrolase [Acidobacteriota bacterium]TDI51007.1 MAG: MBL fold metallo-hydrolase [Acidobacteriota bacterium]TDI51380.1 MAG: MBL fold metallo-hydrolase [Acidobacteriota bacterium]
MSIPAPQSLDHGIHLIPVPLPYKSPPWVNVYAVESNGGLLLIDCGTDWEPGREAIRQGFADLGLEESAVHTLVVSHLHPDHVGMSARLVSDWGCRFVMHERAAKLVDRYNDSPGYMNRLVKIGSVHGIPDSATNAATHVERPDYMPLLEPPDFLVGDGDTIDLGDGRSLHVVHTPGHEPAHICLRDSRTGILFSGDHILPRISPVIMYDLDLGDVLGDYLGSLQRLIAMDLGVTYPAHGTLIDQGGERARQILLHHDRRLLDMAELVRSEDTTAWNVMLKSFRPNLDPLQSRLAFLETISHLEHLRLTGRIRDEERNGKVIYRA